MTHYLIDANLPYRFSFWSGDDYTHVKDLNDEWSDSQIWLYAKQQELVIVSKDADFSDLMMLNEPPRVIHIKIGNIKMRDLYVFIANCWQQVCELSKEYKLVNVYQDRIEGIN